MKTKMVELYHGSFFPRYRKMIKPMSFCMGNAVESPANVTYCWRTWEEAAVWSVYRVVQLFQEFVNDPMTNPDLFKSMGFKPLPDCVDRESFILGGYVWDPLKHKIIIVKCEENEIALHNIKRYFELNEIISYQYKVLADKKNIGKGHTATEAEITVNGDAEIVHEYRQTLYPENVDYCVEWVSENYFEAGTARRYASLFNRGLTSFLFTNELVYNVLHNNDNFGKTRLECGGGKDSAFIKNYLRHDKGAIEHLYPIKRIKLYREAKRELKAIEKA